MKPRAALAPKKQNTIAYSFIRFSSKKQELSSSVRRQTRITEEYAQKHGLKLDQDKRLFALGISGYSGKHIAKGSALAGFLQAAKAGDIPPASALLVEKLDRLSRLEPSKAVRLFLDILGYGIEIHTVGDGQVFTEQKVNDDLSQLYISIGGLVAANRYSKDLGKRVAYAWQEKKQDAANGQIATTKVPAWLKVVGRRNEGGKMRGGQFEVIEPRAEIVREMFRLKALGMGKKRIRTRIAAELNSRGMKPFGSSKAFHDSYITATLKNRAVIGEYQPHKNVDGVRKPVGAAIENYYPKIVSRHVFLKCNPPGQTEDEKRSKRGGSSARIVRTCFVASCSMATQARK